ncbi:ABC transporter B family member 1-like isoform X2 [Corticium candelabrum]|uniref:ABC transporter B family member 1-like isoform X2 n=1 Tax=Corticium candelabrum TaxID=121492 RepID=UPI002E2708A0|nr:ABC transporter B family member 1-like isoform X2 [Corticium candelabrum]
MAERLYRLGIIRFSTIFGALLFVDFALTVSLWLSGSPSEEAESKSEQQLQFSITSFTWTNSVFDLVLVSLAKLLLCAALLWNAENSILHELWDDKPYERPHARRTRLMLILILVCILINVVYVVAKDGVILSDDDGDIFGKDGMPVTYGVCLITSSLFAVVELGFCVFMFKYLNSARFRIAAFALHLNTSKDDGSGKWSNETEKDSDEKEKYRVPVHRVLGLAKPELPLLVPATFFLLIATGSMVLAPRYFGKVIDAAVQKNRGKMNEDVWILLGVFLAGSIAGMFRSFFFVLAGERLVARLRQRLFGSVMKQEVAFFDVTRTGELTSRLSSDTQVVQDAVTSNLSMLIRYALLIIASLVFMFVLSWKLTLVLLAVVPIVSIGAVIYGNYIKKLRKQFQDLLAEAGTVAEESISSIRTVRSFSNEEKSMDNYNDGIDKSYHVGKKSALAIGIFNGCVFSVIQGACVLVLWYGSTLVVSGELSAGLLTSFMLYMFNIAMAFAFISNLYGVFMQAVGASTRIFQLLDRVPSISIAGGTKLLMFEGSIEFQQVSFKYPSRPDTSVLKKVTFYVKRGTVVALVGPSGGGKSTIVNLIERFYTPIEGKICLGKVGLISMNLIRNGFDNTLLWWDKNLFCLEARFVKT